MEPTQSSERIYEGRVVSLRVDTVTYPNGETGKREIIEHAPVVVIAPLDRAGHLLLVRQYRKPVEESLLELPAGGIDPGETPETAARRELVEETGCLAGTLRPLGAFYSAPGYCNELLHLFVASDLAEGVAEPEEDEVIEIVRVTTDEARRLIHSGDIRDSKSIAGIYRLLDYFQMAGEDAATP